MGEPGFYGVASIGPATSQGVTGTMWATLDGVVKVNSPVAPYTVANEYVCGRLAQILGLPVPPGTIATLNDGQPAYVMLKFGHKGDKPPKADIAAFVAARPKLAARIAVFDCWVINADRHPGNLAYIPGISASVFDHGHALLGIHEGQAEKFLEHNGHQALWQSCLLEHLTSWQDLSEAAGIIRSLSKLVIDLTIEQVVDLRLITRGEGKLTMDILDSRRLAMEKFITGSRQSFPSITDWGLVS